MLIYTSKSPGWGKQKPSQWGPLSAVQHAVKKNCDRLGIAQPFSLFAMWEGAGVPRDIFSSAKSISASPPVPSGDGYFFDGGSVNYAQRADKIGADLSNYKFSIVVLTDAFTSAAAEEFISSLYQSSYNYGRGIFLLSKYSQYEFRINVGGTGVYLRSAASGEGRKTLSAVSNGPADHRIYINDEVSGTSVTDVSGAYIGDVDEVGVGCFIDGNSHDYGATGNIDIVSMFADTLPAECIAELSCAPYALIQPVPQVTYFDMGANLVPNLLTPTNGATIDPATTNEFSWSAVTGASKYHLQIATDADTTYSSPSYEDDNISGGAPLIYTSKSPGWGRTKRQFGPLSAVQSAVRDNCEKFLGTPAESLLSAMFFWDGAGNPRDIINAENAPTLAGGATYKNNRLDTTSAGDNDGLDSYVIPSAIRQSLSRGTFVLGSDFSDAENYGRIINTNSFRVYINSATFEQITWNINSSIFNTSLSSGLDVGDHQLTLQWRDNNFKEVYHGGDSLGTSSQDVYPHLWGDSATLFYETNYRANGLHDYVLWFDCILSQAQIAKLNETPYALIQPPTNRVYSFGSPATSKTLPADTLTAGDYRWRVRAAT